MMNNLKHRIADAIHRDERFRRSCVPDGYGMALDAAQRVIDELGIQQAEVSSVYPAGMKDPGYEQQTEQSLRISLVRFIADNTPTEFVKKISPVKDPFEHNQMKLRALVITRTGGL